MQIRRVTSHIFHIWCCILLHIALCVPAATFDSMQCQFLPYTTWHSILIYLALCLLSNIFSCKLDFIYSVYLLVVETENFNFFLKFDKINTFSGNNIIHQTCYLQELGLCNFRWRVLILIGNISWVLHILPNLFVFFSCSFDFTFHYFHHNHYVWLGAGNPRQE